MFKSEWTKQKISDVAIINPTSKLPDKFEYVDLESVSGTRLLKHRTEYLASAPSRAQRYAKKGDIFYQTVRPYQKNNYLFDRLDRNFVFSTGYAQIRSHIDNKLLFFALQRESFVADVLNNCTGTSYPAINTKDLSNIRLYIPNNREEQQKIGEFFKQLDDRIALQQRHVEQLKQSKQGFLQKMFPKDGESVPEVRFDGFSEKWVNQKLKDISSHRGGTAIEKYFSDEGEYKVISIGSYKLDGTYKDQNIRALSNSITDQRVVKKNELTMVLNDKTSTGEIIGRVLHVETDNEFVINQRTEIISVNENVDSKFIYHNINGPFRKKIKSIAQGGTQIYVNFSAVEKLDIYIPCQKEQQKIGEFFKQLDDLIAKNERELELLKETKKGFLQKMFV